MIVIQLMGGLGNQLFQYAFGKHLAILNKTDLLLYTGYFKRDIREYALAPFALEASFCSEELAQEFLKQKSWRKLLPSSKRLGVEQTLAFEQHWLQKYRQDIFLMGYWQHEKYFLPIEAEIRAAFQLKNDLDIVNTTCLQQIRSSNSVGLHIRRGDMANNPKTFQQHGICGLDYYRTAIQYIAGCVEHPQFFIFSDDLEWAKAHLQLAYSTVFVDQNNGQTAYLDLYLLSQCQHQIIANSSFSWWAAWLNPNMQKQIVAPKQYMANPILNAQIAGIIPTTWHRI